MDAVRHLVVGAGISGLAFADWLGDDDCLICEAEPEVGGYCRTIRRDGFTWDFSGHFFHFKDPEIERYLVSRMGAEEVLRVERRSGIHWGDRVIDFPFQKNIHQLPKAEFVECLVDLYFREEREPKTFLDMLYLRFGKGIADRFLVPYNEKVYATDLDRLDVDAMGRFFPHADVSDIIRNFSRADNRGYNATFTYPRGGAIQYVRALMTGVNERRLSLGERVISVDPATRIARTELREVRFEHLVSTMPFSKLLAMCGIDHDREIYDWNRVVVFNLGFDRKGQGDHHWVYFPQRDLVFYRVGFYDNIFGDDRMSLYVEIGRGKGGDSGDLDLDDLERQTLEDLARCGVVTDQKLVASHRVVLDPAYVHITRRSLADVPGKKAALESLGIHSIGRYGSWTYCSIEDNIVEARALADRLRG